MFPDMSVRLGMFKYCDSNLGAIYVKGLFVILSFLLSMVDISFSSSLLRYNKINLNYNLRQSLD